MKITVEIDDRRIREDEPRAYEDAINAFADEWKRKLALDTLNPAATPPRDVFDPGF